MTDDDGRIPIPIIDNQSDSGDLNIQRKLQM